jgi:predicted histone-like DNA-binding protein
MSILYKAIAKGHPGVVGGGEKKFYASIVRERQVPLRAFVEEISSLNTLNTADVLAVLESFLQLTTKHLSQGRSIDMGQLGIFSPSIQSTGELTAAAVDRQSITRFKVNFRPSGILKDRLATIKFEKVAGPTTDEEPEAPEEA